MHPLALHIGPYGDVQRTSGRFSETPSGRNFAEWDSYDYFHVEISLKLLVKPLPQSTFSLIT